MNMLMITYLSSLGPFYDLQLPLFQFPAVLRALCKLSKSGQILHSVTCISFDLLDNLTVCQVSYLPACSFERTCDNSFKF